MKAVSDVVSSKYGCRWGYGVAGLDDNMTAANFPPANEMFTHYLTNGTHCETFDTMPNTALGATRFATEMQRALDLKVRCIEIYKQDFERTDNNMQTTITNTQAAMKAIPNCAP